MTPPAPPLLSLAECMMFDENEMEDEYLYFIAKAFKDIVVDVSYSLNRSRNNRFVSNVL